MVSLESRILTSVRGGGGVEFIVSLVSRRPILTSVRGDRFLYHSYYVY